MGFAAVFWREMLVFRRNFVKFFASRLVGPFLYLVAFGWGLGRGLQLAGGSYLDFVVPGIMALSAMTTSFNAVGVPLNMSRLYYKTLEEYLIAPVSPLGLALGKVLAGTVRGAVAVAIILALAYAFGARPAIDGWVALGTVLTCFVFASLGLLAGMTVNSHEDMANFNTFVIVPMSFLCATFFSPDKLPRWVAGAVEVLPLTHASHFLRAVTSGAPAPWVSLGVLVFYGVVLFAAGLVAVGRVRD